MDHRYRTRYSISVVENLFMIRESGLEALLEKETQRWKCGFCGGTVCVHRKTCAACGKEQISGKAPLFMDLTLKVTPEMVAAAQGNEKKSLVGHLGTHFDVMDHEFPLDYVERQGIVFDVSHVGDREIDAGDIDLKQVGPHMFVAFHSGFIEAVPYGSDTYFKQHPQLSSSLIDALLEKKISIIGIDFAGVRRGPEHTPKDQYCADRGVFIIENLCNLKALLGAEPLMRFQANTYPVNYTQMTGLPCRVVAKLES